MSESNPTLPQTKTILATAKYLLDTQEEYKKLHRIFADYVRNAASADKIFADMSKSFTVLGTLNPDTDVGTFYTTIGAAYLEIHEIYTAVAVIMSDKIVKPFSRECKSDLKRYSSFAVTLRKGLQKRDKRIDTLYKKVHKVTKTKKKQKLIMQYDTVLEEARIWKDQAILRLARFRQQQYIKLLRGFFECLDKYYEVSGQIYALLDDLKQVMTTIAAQLSTPSSSSQSFSTLAMRTSAEPPYPQSGSGGSDQDSSDVVEEEAEEDYSDFPKATALYDYESRDQTEISLKAGDRIIVTEQTSTDWYSGRVGDQEGLFPAGFVQMDD